MILIIQKNCCFFYRIFHSEDIYYNEVYVFPKSVLM